MKKRTHRTSRNDQVTKWDKDLYKAGQSKVPNTSAGRLVGCVRVERHAPNRSAYMLLINPSESAWGNQWIPPTAHSIAIFDLDDEQRRTTGWGSVLHITYASWATSPEGWKLMALWIRSNISLLINNSLKIYSKFRATSNPPTGRMTTCRRDVNASTLSK